MGWGQDSVPDISTEILWSAELYHSVSYQNSTKWSFLVVKGYRGIKLCSLSAKAKNKYNYLHTAYITIIHHINITLQWLTPLLHIRDVLGAYLGLETSWLAFCIFLSPPDKCQSSSLIQAVTNSTCFPILIHY
jgi:hypothetical protein